MRRQSPITIRVIAALMALLMVLVCLPVVPAQAAPEEGNEDHDDITVLSVIVNTNTETNEVFTELILQNKGTEDQQITFPLPETYAGVNMKTLAVKTANGENLAHDNGVVTLDIKAGGFAGVSYTYKTKKNLAYEHVISFDLKQLSALFNDRIGHLEWTVDMPLYEVTFVSEVQPINYTCKGSRVCVELDNFLISRFLDRVYLSRDTISDIWEELEKIEEWGKSTLLARFVLENYKEWYEHPKLLKFDNEYKMWLYCQGWGEDDINKLIYLTPPTGYIGYIENDGYDQDMLDYYTQVNWSYTDSTRRLFASLYDRQPYGAGSSYDIISGGYAYTEEEPEVYAILFTKLPEVEGAKWRLPSEVQMEVYLKTEPTYYYDRDDFGKYRIVYLHESDFEEPEIVRDYLAALHVQAVVRSKIVLEDSEEYQKLGYTLDPYFGWKEYRTGNFSYDGTKKYPYKQFKKDFEDSGDSLDGNDYVSLIHADEPLKDELPIPILTQYWGYASREVDEDGKLTGWMRADYYISNTLMSDCEGIDRIKILLNHPTPQSMIAERDAAHNVAVKENDRLIAKAYEELNMPEVPEAPTVPPTEAPTQEIETTEPSTESGTEETMESTEAAAEATVESTEEKLAEESTAAVADETETFASKDTKDPSDKGILVLLIAIVAGVVLVGAATAVVVVKKKSKVKE